MLRAPDRSPKVLNPSHCVLVNNCSNKSVFRIFNEELLDTAHELRHIRGVTFSDVCLLATRCSPTFASRLNHECHVLLLVKVVTTLSSPLAS